MFDIGEFDGERYLTMEFIEGESLTAHIGIPGAALGAASKQLALRGRPVLRLGSVVARS